MLKDKALENLAAGDLLLDRGMVNAAASRLYYAMYEAAVCALSRRGLHAGQVRSGAVEWDHSMVENNSKWLRRSPQDRLLYMEMRRMRSQADYDDESVDATWLANRRDAISQFVKELAR
jgi:uncharacterized protein (UPF0332 family)